MASIYNEVNDRDFRDSVLLQPQKEGHLDRKEAGVFARGKTNRRWCSVQGPMFYQKKESTQGPGAIEVLYMSDVQVVRPITSDTAEKQFEIVVKKSKPQVFVCSNKNERQAWIKALQNAMMITCSRSSPDGSRSSFYTNPSVYETISGPINYDKPSMNGTASTLLGTHAIQKTNNEQMYAEPQDSMAESVYNDIGDVSATQNSPQGSATTSNTPPELPPRSEMNSQSQSDLVYYDCRSPGETPSPNATVEKETSSPNATVERETQSQTTDEHAEYSDSCSTGVTTQHKYVKKNQREDGVNTSFRSYQIGPVEQRVTTHTEQQSSYDLDETDVKILVTSEEDDLEALFEALNRPVSPTPELDYMVSKSDRKPVKDLKDYLRNNQVQCRISATRLSQSSDPISSCKAYLATLNDII